MSQWDKLIKRIISLDKDMRFEELKKILEYYGYECSQRGSGSSHYIFRKAGCNSITIPKHKPIKVVYIELVKEIVLKGERNENN